MKKVTFIGLLLLVGAAVYAQRPDVSARCKEAMKALSYFVGDWKGTATVHGQQGPTTLQQTEHIEWKLDGLVLSVEGIGKQNGETTFHAFAVINFDVSDQQFKFRSYVKEGFYTNAYFKEVQPNQFEWGFDVANNGGKTRYTITLDDKKGTWLETGEFSRDGNNWMKFIELNLSKL